MTIITIPLTQMTILLSKMTVQVKEKMSTCKTSRRYKNKLNEILQHEKKKLLRELYNRDRETSEDVVPSPLPLSGGQNVH